jgi:hypothetical protein
MHNCTLDPPEVRAAAIADPRGFLETFPPPMVIDEVQYAPELLPYVKERIDARREAQGHPHEPLPWEAGARKSANHRLSCLDLWKSFLCGGYPELVAPRAGGQEWPTP